MLTAKCHRDTTLAVTVAFKATKSLPGIVPQQLPTVAVRSRFKLPAGYTKASSVNTSALWHFPSVFFHDGTVTHAELLDFLGFGVLERDHVDSCNADRNDSISQTQASIVCWVLL